MKLQLRMHTPFLPSMIYSRSYMEQRSLQNLISNGDTIMYESKRMMNGKVPSSLKEDYLNQQ